MDYKKKFDKLVELGKELLTLDGVILGEISKTNPNMDTIHEAENARANTVRRIEQVIDSTKQ